MPGPSRMCGLSPLGSVRFMIFLLLSSPPQLACRRGTGADAGIADDRPPMVRQGADASARCNFVRRVVRLAYRALLQLPDPAAPVQKLLDVERPGMPDGSADPHHPSANSTVDRYRSPESGSTVTIVLPA